MYKLIAVFCLVFSLVAHSAEDEALWTSEAFAAPYTGDVVAISEVISNNNEFYSSIKVDIEYEALSPAQCDCELTAVIEEELAPGLWKPLGYQFEKLNWSLSSPTRILIVSPAINFSPGVDNFVAIGEGIRISQSQGNVPEKIRVVIYKNDTGIDTLQSVTISGYSKLYN